MVRVLFVCELPPIPTVGGNMQRTNLISRALGTFSKRDLLVLQRPDVYAPDHEQQLRDEHGLVASVPLRPRGEYGAWKWIRPIRPAGIDRIARVLSPRSTLYSPDPQVNCVFQGLLARNRYDLVVGRYLRATAWCGAINHSSVMPPVILDLDDLDTQVARRQAELASHWNPVRALARWHMKELQKLVPRALARTAHVWVANPVDLKEISYPHVSVLPNIPFPRPNVSDATGAPLPPNLNAKVVLSVGGMGKTVQPAFDRFIFHIWPKIRSASPEARFRIVGTGISDKLQEAWAAVPGVEPVGFVNDLKPEYAACAFTLVPFQGGGGTKIKVLESLNYGRTCLMYKHANRGFDSVLLNRQSVWLVDDEPAMVRACVHLLARPELSASLGVHGARQVAAHYSYASFEAEVHRTLSNALERAAQAGHSKRQE